MWLTLRAARGSAVDAVFLDGDLSPSTLTECRE